MWVRAVVTIALWLLPTAVLAQAEKRIALLIGNQAYGNEIGRLTNPHNDVAVLERSLKRLGFEVTTMRDAGLGGLHQAVNAYARRVQAAGPNAVGFFYSSGHGAADGGVNYLIPVDVKTTDTSELWDQSLRLTEITRKLKAEAGNATHFVVFDACRNTLKLTKGGSRGLVQSKGFVPVAQESGMLIAYATAEGELASDVGDGAGPYAKALAEEISEPGVEAVAMFRRVQVRVRSSIGQEPWLGFSALGEVHFAGAAAEAMDPAKPSSQSAGTPAEPKCTGEKTYDGEWLVDATGGQGCYLKQSKHLIVIKDGKVLVPKLSPGKIDAAGNFKYQHLSFDGNATGTYTGKLSFASCSGSGTYDYSGFCKGTLKLTKR